MEDLLKNTHSVLGLALKREEAEVVVSMFDVNGDQTIQCEELEVGKQGSTCGWKRRGWKWHLASCTCHFVVFTWKILKIDFNYQ